MYTKYNRYIGIGTAVFAVVFLLNLIVSPSSMITRSLGVMTVLLAVWYLVNRRILSRESEALEPDDMSDDLEPTAETDILENASEVIATEDSREEDSKLPTASFHVPKEALIASEKRTFWLGFLWMAAGGLAIDLVWFFVNWLPKEDHMKHPEILMLVVMAALLLWYLYIQLPRYHRHVEKIPGVISLEEGGIRVDDAFYPKDKLAKVILTAPVVETEDKTLVYRSLRLKEDRKMAEYQLDGAREGRGKRVSFEAYADLVDAMLDWCEASGIELALDGIAVSMKDKAKGGE